MSKPTAGTVDLRRWDKLVAKAVKTNAKRDEADRLSGFATPSQLDPASLLRTAMSAIKCGINLPDDNCIAEAFLFIQEAERRIRIGPDKEPFNP